MFISPILWAPQQPSEDFHFLTLANNALGLTHKYTGGGVTRECQLVCLLTGK